jgi:hypothetical protein
VAKAAITLLADVAAVMVLDTRLADFPAIVHELGFAAAITASKLPV